MQNRRHDKTTPTLIEVKKQFSHWRKTRKTREPIPSELLSSAVSLAAEYSLTHISRSLKLHYTTLKRRVNETSSELALSPQNQAAFIEVDIPAPKIPNECIVEMENSEGSRMRITIRDDTYNVLSNLSETFWRQGL